MLSPYELQKINNSKYNLNEIIQKIDKSMLSFHGWYPWEKALVDYDLPKEIRDKIAKKYIEAGWNYVYHNTSKENGERAGLTSFMFSTIKIEDKYVKNKFCIRKGD